MPPLLQNKCVGIYITSSNKHKVIFCFHFAVIMRLFVLSIVLSFLCGEVKLVLGDIGTATSYGPPYIPTGCFGNQQDQFPPGNLFVAVSEGLWDNGAACGRRYRLRCLSGHKKPCKGGATVDVKVVDLCRISPCPSTIAISTEAFAAISHSPTKINVEYIQI